MMTPEEARSRCWAEVDLTRLRQNYRNALKHLTTARLIAVLKADAYGLGAKKVAQVLYGEGQRFFAVASYNEAEELYALGLDADVLVLGLMGDRQLDQAIEKGMVLTVFSRAYAESVVAAAKRVGKKARVHLKVETGLHRLGLMPEEVEDVAVMLAKSGAASIEGLFTHLALRSYENDQRQFARLRFAREALERRGLSVMTHALDSIGMVRYPGEQMDAVRTGAWLYGVYPRGYEHPEESQLTMTVKARVAQLHTVPTGECLGYDEDNPLARDSVIATISAGYIDGFPRLNNTGTVEIRGKRAPVAGLVCMDQMMADVTDIPGVREGDEVILLGGSIGVDEYASVAHLNRNESLARTGRRVPRVYMENGEVTDIVQEM